MAEHSTATLDLSDWAVPPATEAHAVQMRKVDAESALQLTKFSIPAGPLPHVERSYILTIVTQLPRPNWWFRMWSRLLLGWRWEIVPNK